MPDHDDLFKKLIRQHFYDFADLFLPADFVSELDRASSPAFLEQELPTSLGKRRNRFADLIVQTQYAGANKSALVHFEFESTCRRDFAERMFSTTHGCA